MARDSLGHQWIHSIHQSKEDWLDILTAPQGPEKVGRVCKTKGCGTVLSAWNPDKTCALCERRKAA